MEAKAGTLESGFYEKFPAIYCNTSKYFAKPTPLTRECKWGTLPCNCRDSNTRKRLQIEKQSRQKEMFILKYNKGKDLKYVFNTILDFFCSFPVLPLRYSKLLYRNTDRPPFCSAEERFYDKRHCYILYNWPHAAF